MSQFFRKIGSQVQSAFRKAPAVISTAFRKGSDLAKQASKVGSDVINALPKLSDTLGTVSQGLAKAARVGTQVLESPAATAFAAGFGPEGLAAQMAARKVLGGLAKGSNLAAKASHITDTSSYKGGKDLSTTLENIRDAQKRAGDIKEASKAPSLTFA